MTRVIEIFKLPVIYFPYMIIYLQKMVNSVGEVDDSILFLRHFMYLYNINNRKNN